MIIRSKAPLRLGLAGGGTDVSPYCDLYGGYILNTAIDMYAFCSIQERSDGITSFEASDLGQKFESESESFIEPDGKLKLHKGIYNRIVKDFNKNRPLSFNMHTYSDAPAGSGLGSSSTMVVAIIKCYTEWLNLPLGEYDIARLAYDIERKDLQLSGGRQDQYAATFGGFNVMEFFDNERVIVNPLRLKNWIKDELESSMVIYYTGVSRHSSEIIDEQKHNISDGSEEALKALHLLKGYAIKMKQSLLNGNIREFSQLLEKSWRAKKRTARSITNKDIDDIYNTAIEAGAMAGKVSGAGGGGFMIFVVDPLKRVNLIKSLEKYGGMITNIHFTDDGCHGWKIFD